jgi:hypothetical protein
MKKRKALPELSNAASICGTGESVKYAAALFLAVVIWEAG